jgi:hypothetical protein
MIANQAPVEPAQPHPPINGSCGSSAVGARCSCVRRLWLEQPSCFSCQSLRTDLVVLQNHNFVRCLFLRSHPISGGESPTLGWGFSCYPESPNLLMIIWMQKSTDYDQEQRSYVCAREGEK